jgi:serine/threonine protein kinase
MEYMELGDLEKHIQFKWTEGDTRVVARQLLQGLKVMHDDGIIHRDLKPANVFPILLDQSTLRVKIGDFGVSKRLEAGSSTVAETKTGSPAYMAPEVFSPSLGLDGYTNAVDLWALGCILFRMVTGKLPFQDVGAMYLYSFGNAGFPQHELNLANLSGPGIRFIESLIKPDPKTRMTAEHALNSEWITSEPLGFRVTETLACYWRGQSPILESTNDVTRIRVSKPDSTAVTENDTVLTTLNLQPALESKPESNTVKIILPKPKLLGITINNRVDICGFSFEDPAHRFYINDDRFIRIDYCVSSILYYYVDVIPYILDDHVNNRYE